ncbi:receptor-transporting protein 3-like [Hyla sarda]|uniref:receptor-transporting protein 3-like n=1 Tax=Hyla sarda TaxID=327740 RepID=UPI0024C2843C|nr:receptor-transporting protein 3-like [Hyla sarda]XP_056421457.1 receptor-transporting protein 3-like [Hyla sarda]
MEKNIWKNTFENELTDCGIDSVWSFCVEDNLRAQPPYLQYSQRTFARFQCSFCSRQWNSAQVHILVLINWNKINRCGNVKMRIFKQSCRRCNHSTLENPEITKENIRRVIGNVVGKIQSMVYGYTTSPTLEPVVYSDDVDGPHERQHCEACKMNVCPWNTQYGEKAKVIKFQSTNVHPEASSRTQEQYKKTSWATNTPTYTQTTAAYNEENNVILCLIFVLVIIFLLLMSMSK